MNRKDFLFRVVSLAVGCCCALVVAETGLRLLPPDHLRYKSVRKLDPVRHHRLEPAMSCIIRSSEFTYELRTNALGLRDEEWTAGKQNETRIIVLGDSFVEGIGVELQACMVQQLEKRLNLWSGVAKTFEVFNFGVAGYSPIIEFLHLKGNISRLQPHLVILCYDMTDVQDDYMYGEDAEFDSTGAPVRMFPSTAMLGKKSRFPRSRWKTNIQENSYLYTLVAQTFRDRSERVELRPGDIASGRHAHTVDSIGIQWEKYFERSFSYVERIVEVCRQNNARFVLSVHPRGHQVSSREWGEGRRSEGLDSGVYRSAIFSYLKKFADERHISFINMTSAFQAHSNGDLYYRIDSHWTMRGNSVAADTVFTFLVQNNLISK